MTLRNTAFSPPTLTAKVGQTIVWTNADPFVHNVTATAGASFRSASLAKGASFRFTPRAPGTITYVCTIHANMTARLVVTR